MTRFGKFAGLVCSLLVVLSLTAARKSKTAGDAVSGQTASTGISQGNVIFDMNSIAGWNAYVDNSVTTSFAVVAGRTGKAFAIGYNFNTGLWLSVARTQTVDLSKYKGIKFAYKGEGARNTFEIKMEDGDGSTFGYYVEPRSNPSNWTDIDIPFTDMKWWWGGDQTLDLKKVRFHIAVSKRDDDEGGEGKVIVSPVSAY
jgi:hypothetical protein